MGTTAKEHKKAILGVLTRAGEATLEEQDGYREIIDKAKNLPGEINNKLLAGGDKWLLDTMKDCCYPPIHADREKFLKISWDKTLKRTMLNKIGDQDIRSRVFFLNEFVEHTQRLRAMAAFSVRVAPLNGPGGHIYTLWSKRSSLQILCKEAVAMGKDKEAEYIQLFIKAMDFIIKHLASGGKASSAKECIPESYTSM